MVVDFSKINPSEKPTLILRNLDGTAIQTLGYAINVRINPHFNEISELSFELPAVVDGVPTPNYALVVGMRIVEVADVGQFILIDPEETDDGLVKKKNCKGYSLEYEFAKKDIYIPEGRYKFYDALAPENTILGMILEKMPDWSIGDISKMDFTKYRSFGEIRNKVYNFIKSDVQETFGCIFDFDTMNRKVNVIGVEAELPTKKVALTTQRLLKKVNKSEDSDGIITCLEVNGADGVNIRSVNPTGKNYIYNLDYFMTEENFSSELIGKWRAWERAVESSRDRWKSAVMDFNMQSTAILTQQAALTDLKGELTDLENRQAVIIKAIQKKLKEQSDLDEINVKINEKQIEISGKEQEISEIQSTIDDDRATMTTISRSLDFEDPSNSFFTAKELSILRRYFIEDSLEDSSFEVDAVSAYNDTPHTASLYGGVLNIACSTPPQNAEKYTTITGCTISVGSVFLAHADSAVLYIPENGQFILTATVSNGSIIDSGNGDTVGFSSGNLTLTGTATIATSSDDLIQLAISSAELYFTRNHTSYETMTVEEALYEYGKQVLNDKAFPTYHFEVDSGDFLTAEGFEAFKNEFSLGSRVYLLLGEDETPIKPYVVSAEIQYGNPSGTKLEFSSDYTSADRSFALAKLLEQSVSLGKTLSSKSGIYASFVESGASSSVKEFMDSALDVAKNRILSSQNQAIEFGDAGIRVRQWNETKTGYEPEEIWIVDNMIVFTDDNWATAKMALGRIVDENLISNLNPDGTAYGIVAPYLVGTMLAGQNLVIDTENGSFRVDGSGVHVDSLKMYITHGEDAGTTEKLGDRLDTINIIAQQQEDAISELNKAMSGVITTYYDNQIPENPVKGDLWFVTGDVAGTSYKKNELWRYGGSIWQRISDADAIRAISDAATAQSTADKKIKAFYQELVPTKDVDDGDLWFRTSNVTAYRKLYRYSKADNAWLLVEDGQLRILDSKVLQINQTLSDLILKNGYLKAEKLSGYIDSSISKMRSQTGNVLFDSDGIWLLNAAKKEDATQGVWLGEKGIAFGSGNKTSNPSIDWDWTTFLGHDGIAADALASTYLSAIHIRGGDIEIGDNFKVDKDGNLTANKGTFSGTLSAPNLNGKLQGEDDAWLIGMGISVGPDADESGGNFYVDPKGNVTTSGNVILGGNITLSGNIDWSAGNNPMRVKYSIDGSGIDGSGVPSGENWHDDLRATDNYVVYSYDGGKTWTSAIRFRGEKGDAGESVDLSSYGIIKSTYLDETKILSPMILGGHLYATGKGAENTAAFYICDGVTGITPETQQPGNIVGYISYDTTGKDTGDESRNRVIFRTQGVPMKLLGDGNGISIGTTGNGKIYIDSDIQFKSGITVTGLTATFG